MKQFLYYNSMLIKVCQEPIAKTSYYNTFTSSETINVPAFQEHDDLNYNL